MPLSTTQEAVLSVITRKLPRKATWCLFGSTDSVLRGLDAEPSDIDILATEETAEQFRDLFSDDFVDTREIGHSQIDAYQMNGEEVEVIFSYREKSHQKPLVSLEELTLEVNNDRGVPMLPLQSLLYVYRQIDRNETANRLESRLDLTDD